MAYCRRASVNWSICAAGPYGGCYPRSSLGRILVLPDPDGGPPCLLETPVGVGVAALVRLYLVTPEVCIPLRPGTVYRAPMPEAPVDEYSHTSAAEDDISPAAHAPNGALVDAVAQSKPMEFRTQRDLRCRVPPPSGSHAACHLLRGGFRDTLANPLAPCHPTLLRLRIEGIHDHGRQRMRWYHAHRSDDGVDESRLRNDLRQGVHGRHSASKPSGRAQRASSALVMSSKAVRVRSSALSFTCKCHKT